MANPQIENGFTKIANEIMEALISCNLSGQDFKITLLIIRKTYGFNKHEDAVSLSQMMTATGMGKIRCSQVVKRLQLMKILTVTENINGIGKKYKFNKDFETWTTVNKNINRYQKTKSTVNILRNRPLIKTLTTKERTTKETIQKKVEIPEWINKETWEAFIEMRKVIKKPMTNRAVSLMVNKLEKFKFTGHSVNEILNQSILNNWQDVYELRGDNGKGRFVQGDRRTLREREVDAEAERINSEYEKHKASKAATAKNAGQNAT